MDPPEPVDSSPNSSLPTSNSQLAALLSDAFRDADALRRELSITRKRVEKAERLIQNLTSDSTSSPPNGNPQEQQHQQAQRHAQTIKLLTEDYEDRLAQAELARDEAEARRRLIQESWEQVERYLALVESRAKDARIAFARISEGSVASLVLPPLPTHIGTGAGSLSTYPPSSSSQIMAPPNVPSRQHSRHRHSAAFPALPPHPIPNPNPNLSPSAGTRRPRTPSLDGLYNATQPPSKRSRANTDDQRAREPRPSYSESYVGNMQQQQHLPRSSDSRDYQEQYLARARQHQLIQRSQAPRIIKHADPHGQHPSQRPDSHDHSRSSSSSSLDVDEMLLRATTGDEHGEGMPNGTGAPYLDSSHHSHLNINQRRRNERDGDSPRPHSANNNNGHPPHITSATNPYPQHPSNVSYPANQSAPVMTSLRPAQSSQNQVIQTHIFAPVVTGAPTKKSKFPNTIPAGPGSGMGLPGSGPSLDAGTPAVTVPFAATNAQGQRICRQCGMVGRYKDGKCVEKWGPGPMGPGTVCDRCRKKMKRVERRGTLENQQQQVANQSILQQQQHQPRSTSHQTLPLSQGSDRFIHRADTILTQQPSHNPSAFSQSQSHSQINRDRDNSSSSHTQSDIRSSLPNTHQSSAQISILNSTKHGSHQRSQRPQSPLPPITALKESHDDDDEQHDPDQLPISNIGRGGSGAPSRSSSRNARVRGGTGSRPTPPVTRSSDNTPNLNGTLTKKSSLGSSFGGGRVGSGSPGMTMEVDEMDADADADAEAEAEAESEAELEILGAVATTSRDRTDREEEVGDDGDGDGEADADADAELLEAVDAAEANSSSSHGGEHMRVKSES